MDGKPVAQMFADDLKDLVLRYQDSGLTNAEAVGTLSMYNFDLKYKIRRDAEMREKNY
jgi:hypothetical protein